MIFKIMTFCLLLSCNVWAAYSGYNTLSGGGYMVEYTGLKKGYGEKALKDIETDSQEISGLLGRNLSHPVKVILTSTDKEFSMLTEGKIPEWGAAVALSDSLIIVTPLNGMKYGLRGILTHELVHIFINDAADRRFVPRWFHEGVAQEISGEWSIRGTVYIVWRASRDKLLSFDDIQNVFSSGRADADLAYDQSMLAIKHLMRRNGSKVLPKILNNMQKGDDFADAFWKATGLWPSEFEKDYLEAVKITYGKKSLYTLIPGTWTIILIISFVVYFIKKYRTKKVLEQWEKEDETENEPDYKDFTSDEEDYLDTDAEEIFPDELPENVINFNDYKKKH